MKKLRIGVMGCADIARRLMIPAILELNDKLELVAVASRTKEKADEYADMFGCDSVVGYDELLSRDDIDAIYMPLPTGLHYEWIIKSLSKGKHVYAEKSIAMHYHEACEMVDFAKSNGLALMEGFMFQYHKQHEVVKKLLASDAIGTPRLYRASFGFPPFRDSNNFRYDNKIGGGALRDAAGYVLRAVNFLNNNKFEVTDANVFYDDKGTSLYGSAFLKDGSQKTAEISFGFDNFYQCNYEIWGSKGKISCLKSYTPKPDETTTIVVEKQGEKEEIKCEPFNHFVAAMGEFYRICNDADSREKHYIDIKLQSNGLDQIETLSKKN
jgi:predicted dehydrogenase